MAEMKITQMLNKLKESITNHSYNLTEFNALSRMMKDSVNDSPTDNEGNIKKTELQNKFAAELQSGAPALVAERDGKSGLLLCALLVALGGNITTAAGTDIHKMELDRLMDEINRISQWSDPPTIAYPVDVTDNSWVPGMIEDIRNIKRSRLE